MSGYLDLLAAKLHSRMAIARVRQMHEDSKEPAGKLYHQARVEAEKDGQVCFTIQYASHSDTHAARSLTRDKIWKLAERDGLEVTAPGPVSMTLRFGGPYSL